MLNIPTELARSCFISLQHYSYVWSRIRDKAVMRSSQLLMDYKYINYVFSYEQNYKFSSKKRKTGREIVSLQTLSLIIDANETCFCVT